jgi:PAS domain S-box-containing protein
MFAPMSVPNPAVTEDQRHRLALHALASGVAIVDLQGRWADVNPALSHWLGSDAQAMRGQPVALSIHPDDAAAAHAHLVALAVGHTPPGPWPTRWRSGDGGTLQASAVVSVVRDDSGAPCFLLLQLHESGAPQGKAQPQEEQTLRQALAERDATVHAQARQQEVFAYGISHDLRAPLRAIENFSALLDRQSAALDETGRGYLQRIRAAATRMGELIDTLLDLSRVDRAELVPEPVDLGLLAGLAVAELQELEPGRAVDLDIAPELIALGDERQLRMLLTQLLRNAWNFSAERERVWIDIIGKRSDDLLRVSVRDHGSGFDMRYAEKLFEPFQRLHGPEQGSGNGIGLAIAKRIVERHGGRIWAESGPGAGSTFHFELPAASAATNHGEHNA